MAKWYSIPTTMRMSEGEYRANCNGINIVFGAVLGFVLAGAERMPDSQFALTLLLSASLVITILYLETTEYRLFYAAMAILFIAFLPRLFEAFELPLIPKLQPTLGVWLLMVLLIELAPRDKDKTFEKEPQ